MTIFRDALKVAGLTKIKIVEGGIYRLRDKAIHFPDTDADDRTRHEFRTVLVISNQRLIDSYSCPCVTVAPMSHKTHPKSIADLIIKKNQGNNLSSDSRVLFGHIQPVLKGDLEKQIGVLSEDEWREVMAHIVSCFDH